MTPGGTRSVRRRRRGAVLAVAGCALWMTVACGGGPRRDPCSQADLEVPTPAGMPVPERVERARTLNRARLDPVPAGYQPVVPAAEAWAALAGVRPSTGGGRDQLLLGLLTGDGHAGIPAWVAFTEHRAQRLDPLALPPGVSPRAGAGPCVFVDVVNAVDAQTGALFFESTVTSAET